jgi:predicted nucleic acid-binding protein
MKIYLDTCALNRPTDDLSQPRIRIEAEAVGRILDLVFEGKIIWVASSVLRFELEQNPDSLRRTRAMAPLPSASIVVVPDAAILTEATRLISHGLSTYDALHLSLAHRAGVEWLITTDDRLIRAAALAYPGDSPFAVNPEDWLHRRKPWLLQQPSGSAT